jgi:hypothetical protein
MDKIALCYAVFLQVLKINAKWEDRVCLYVVFLCPYISSSKLIDRFQLNLLLCIYNKIVNRI